LTSCHLSSDLKRSQRRGWQVNLTSWLVKFHLCSNASVGPWILGTFWFWSVWLCQSGTPYTANTDGISAHHPKMMSSNRPTTHNIPTLKTNHNKWSLLYANNMNYQTLTPPVKDPLANPLVRNSGCWRKKYATAPHWGLLDCLTVICWNA